MPYNRLNKGIANTFDIVTAPFINFEGVREIGMFLVLYKESLDDSVPYPQNIIGAKLTSKATANSGYRVLLRRKDFPFLIKDSYINLNHLHTIREKECVFLSTLPACYKGRIMLKLKDLTFEFDTQLILDACLGKEVN